VPAGQYAQAKKILETAFAAVYSRYTRTDPDLSCRIHREEGCVQALSEADSVRVKNLLFLLRTEMRKCHGEDPTIIMGSGSLIKAAMTEGFLDFEYAVRAVEDSVRDQYGEHTEEILRLLGFPWTIGKHYGGWPMQPGSQLVALFDRKHEEIFGYPAGHRFVHGGIEVGDIVAAIPDMDAIAINLPMENAHTTNELLYIDRVPEFWALFTAVFAEK
jgi:di/tripeptidase